MPTALFPNLRDSPEGLLLWCLTALQSFVGLQSVCLRSSRRIGTPHAYSFGSDSFGSPETVNQNEMNGVGSQAHETGHRPGKTPLLLPAFLQYYYSLYYSRKSFEIQA